MPSVPPEMTVQFPLVEELVRDAKRTERLVAAALKPGATGPQMRAASIATQRLYGDMAFMTRCRSRGPAERDLFLGLWREKEDHALGQLVAAASELACEPS